MEGGDGRDKKESEMRVRGKEEKKKLGSKRRGKVCFAGFRGWTPYVTPHSGGVLLSIQNADIQKNTIVTYKNRQASSDEKNHHSYVSAAVVSSCNYKLRSRPRLRVHRVTAAPIEW